MRLLLTSLLICAVSAVAEYFLPWWSAAVVAFIFGFLMRLSIGRAFLAGFLGLAVLWLIWALYWDLPNDHLLAGRMAKVFSLPNAGSFIAVTTILGGLIGGLSAWSGGHLRKLVLVIPTVRTGKVAPQAL